MEKEKILVLYHNPCCDGMAAAWAAWRHFRGTGSDVTYIPIQYGNSPPDSIGDYTTVYLLDFTFKADVVREILENNPRISELTILDHHESAEKDLAALADEPRVKQVFDMTRSGAMISWTYFHASKQPPKIIQYAQDRDLWRFQLPKTHEIHEAMMLVSLDLEEYEKFNFSLEHHFDREAKIGESLLTYRERHLEQILRHVRWCSLGGYTVPIVNSAVWQSEIGDRLKKKAPFVVIWYLSGGRDYLFSMRSDQDRPDEVVNVSELASLYGGGGHRHAAGFSASGLPMFVDPPEE